MSFSDEFEQDEREEHGEVVTHDERREQSRRSSTCQECRKAGRHQVAHRVLPGGAGVCSWHFKGQPHPEELKQKPAAPAPRAAVPPAKTKEEKTTMEKKTCACGCGEIVGKRAFKNGHKPKGEKRAGGQQGSSTSKPRKARSVKPRKPKANGAAAEGVATVCFTEQQLDGILLKQSLEMKASLVQTIFEAEAS